MRCTDGRFEADTLWLIHVRIAFGKIAPIDTKHGAFNAIRMKYTIGCKFDNRK
jgi:hypothetical protein